MNGQDLNKIFEGLGSCKTGIDALHEDIKEIKDEQFRQRQSIEKLNQFKTKILALGSVAGLVGGALLTAFLRLL